MIFQKKTKSQIELEMKQLQSNIEIVKAAENILQADTFLCNPNIRMYIKYAEATIRDMKKAISE